MYDVFISFFVIALKLGSCFAVFSPPLHPKFSLKKLQLTSRISTLGEKVCGDLARREKGAVRCNSDGWIFNALGEYQSSVCHVFHLPPPPPPPPPPVNRATFNRRNTPIDEGILQSVKIYSSIPNKLLKVRF